MITRPHLTSPLSTRYLLHFAPITCCVVTALFGCTSNAATTDVHAHVDGVAASTAASATSAESSTPEASPTAQATPVSKATPTSEAALKPEAAPASEATSKPEATSTPKAVATPTATPKKKASNGKKTYKVVDDLSQFDSLPTPLSRRLKAVMIKSKVPPPPADTKVPGKATVVLRTNKGDITVQLNGKAAPLHVKSFLYLAKLGFYDGTRFHRYEPGFVIQGGDPISKVYELGIPLEKVTGSPSGFHGAGGPGYQIPLERNKLKHDAMVIAAARSGDPDSAGSQFYFTLQPAHFLDQDQAQDGYGYTVFGKVVKGQDVVKKLRANDELESIAIKK